MRTYCKQNLLRDREFCFDKVKKAFHRKWKRHAYQRALAHYCNIPIRDVRNLIKQGRKDELEYGLYAIVDDFQRELSARQFELTPIHYRKRVDGLSGKVREIGIMSVKQQCFEHIIVGALMPLFNAKIAPHQYASVEKRGQVAGMRTIQKWVRKENRRKANAKKHGRHYSGECDSFVKLDVTQCFPSISTVTVMRFLRHDISKNDELLWAVEAILKTHEAGGRGLVIGSLLSQFVCNYLLSYVYRFAMALHVGQDGEQVKMVTHGLFFMDDILLTGNNPDHLRSAVTSVIEYARETIGLTVKPNWHVKNLDDEPIDMMGYVVHADSHVTIRARIFLRTRRAYLRANRKTIDVKCARRLMAYNGYLVHTATHALRERLNVKKIRRIARRIIRNHDRKEKMLHDERNSVYGGAGSYRAVGTST